MNREEADEISKRAEEALEMEKARKALAALFEEGTIPTGSRPCPICKGQVDCESCKGTGLKGAAYCPKCLGFGCCLHCRGQGIIIKDGPEAPCHVCGNIMGNHQPCRIAEYQTARLEAMLNARVEP
jgi:hypothetical protein